MSHVTTSNKNKDMPEHSQFEFNKWLISTPEREIIRQMTLRHPNNSLFDTHTDDSPLMTLIMVKKYNAAYFMLTNIPLTNDAINYKHPYSNFKYSALFIYFQNIYIDPPSWKGPTEWKLVLIELLNHTTSFVQRRDSDSDEPSYFAKFVDRLYDDRYAQYKDVYSFVIHALIDHIRFIDFIEHDISMGNSTLITVCLHMDTKLAINIINHIPREHGLRRQYTNLMDKFGYDAMYYAKLYKLKNVVNKLNQVDVGTRTRRRNTNTTKPTSTKTNANDRTTSVQNVPLTVELDNDSEDDRVVATPKKTWSVSLMRQFVKKTPKAIHSEPKILNPINLKWYFPSEWLASNVSNRIITVNETPIQSLALRLRDIQHIVDTSKHVVECRNADVNELTSGTLREVNYKTTLSQYHQIELGRFGFTIPRGTVSLDNIVSWINDPTLPPTINFLKMRDFYGTFVDYAVQHPSYILDVNSIFNQELNVVPRHTQLALSNYSMHWDVAINSYLRTGNDYFESPGFIDHYKRFGRTHKLAAYNIVHMIEQLDTVFQESLVTQHKITVWRGINPLPTGEITKNMFTGIQTSFLSTTLTSDIARSFITNWSMCCLIKIEVPAGIPYASMHQHISKFNESEILFPRELNMVPNGPQTMTGNIVTHHVRIEMTPNARLRCNSKKTDCELYTLYAADQVEPDTRYDTNNNKPVTTSTQKRVGKWARNVVATWNQTHRRSRQNEK